MTTRIFTLANGNVKEGREDQSPSVFGAGEYDWEEPGTAPTPPDTQTLATLNLQLDRAGAVRATLADLPKVAMAA